MNYYLIAGEASGDLHASNMMKEINLLDPHASFRCWGGDLMKEHGGVLVKHYKDLAFMGFWEVLLNLSTIFANLKFCKRDILAIRPDVIILIDYPGFNLRIAKFAHRHHFRVFYYISPQLWAWKSSRVKSIKRFVDHMFVILPFEKDFYLRYDYPVDFVGHPLLDVLSDTGSMPSREQFINQNHFSQKPIIAVLPGSRKQEISNVLKLILSVIPDFPGYQFIIAAAPSIPPDFYQPYIRGKEVGIVFKQTYPLLKHAHAAVVTSGTATLETALMGVPEVVCYKGSKLSFWIAKHLVHVKYISLVNLIMNEGIVPELIQNELTTSAIRREISRILDPSLREVMRTNYAGLRNKLGGKGASANVASRIIQYLTVK